MSGFRPMSAASAGLFLSSNVCSCVGGGGFFLSSSIDADLSGSIFPPTQGAVVGARLQPQPQRRVPGSQQLRGKADTAHTHTHGRTHTQTRARARCSATLVHAEVTKPIERSENRPSSAPSAALRGLPDPGGLHRRDPQHLQSGHL